MSTWLSEELPWKKDVTCDPGGLSTAAVVAAWSSQLCLCGLLALPEAVCREVRRTDVGSWRMDGGRLQYSARTHGGGIAPRLLPPKPRATTSRQLWLWPLSQAPLPWPDLEVSGSFKIPSCPFFPSFHLPGPSLNRTQVSLFCPFNPRSPGGRTHAEPHSQGSQGSGAVTAPPCVVVMSSGLTPRSLVQAGALSTLRPAAQGRQRAHPCCPQTPKCLPSSGAEIHATQNAPCPSQGAHSPAASCKWP